MKSHDPRCLLDLEGSSSDGGGGDGPGGVTSSPRHRALHPLRSSYSGTRSVAEEQMKIMAEKCDRQGDLADVQLQAGGTRPRQVSLIQPRWLCHYHSFPRFLITCNLVIRGYEGNDTPTPAAPSGGGSSVPARLLPAIRGPRTASRSCHSQVSIFHILCLSTFFHQVDITSVETIMDNKPSLE